MSALAIFSFENSQVRTLGSAESPLFVAIDIAKALGYQNLVRSVNDHVDPEDLTKQEITDSMGRKQTVNCVNESGLYALIFGSKLESAKRFKRWVTNEVLPAIRRNGRYEAPRPETITPDEQLAIQLAVSHRAQKTSKHFQTIYRAIKVRYQIAKYDQLPRAQFEDCLRFIESVELSVPAKPAAPELPDDKILVSRAFLERLRVFVYYWRYLFRDDLERVHGLMESLHSPLAEAVHDLDLSIVECDLEKLGYPVKELKCYKYWLAHQGA